MKTAICVLIACLFVVSNEAKKCRRSHQCGENECCIMKSIFSGGECKPLAKAGEPCMDEDDVDLFGTHCHCEKGLTCEPEEEKDTFFGKMKKNLRCVAEQVTTSEPKTDAPVEETEDPADE